MAKVDLHTHSIASSDGGIKPEQYRQLLENGVLDCVAVTDHNRIDMATQLQKELGNKIIVGEEITTTDGEIIGLFLKRPIQPNLTPLEVVKAIKSQDGLVYIPHPFETVRHGLTAPTLEEISDFIDIVEAHNARAVFQNRGPQALVWAKLHHKIVAASSDAHGPKGLGTTYTSLQAIPTPSTLLELLSTGTLITTRPPLPSLLAPKLNRFRKKLRKHEA